MINTLDSLKKGSAKNKRLKQKYMEKADIENLLKVFYDKLSGQEKEWLGANRQQRLLILEERQIGKSFLKNLLLYEALTDTLLTGRRMPKFFTVDHAMRFLGCEAN